MMREEGEMASRRAGTVLLDQAVCAEIAELFVIDAFELVFNECVLRFGGFECDEVDRAKAGLRDREIRKRYGIREISSFGRCLNLDPSNGRSEVGGM